MTTQRLSLTLDIAGRLAPSLSRAFGRADSLFGGLSRSVRDITRAEREQREELNRVRDARRQAFDAGQDVAAYDRQIRRLNEDLATTTRRLRDATEQEARRQRTFRTAAVIGGAALAGVAGGAALTGRVVDDRIARAREIQRASRFGQTGTAQVQELANLLSAANLVDRQGAAQETGDIIREIGNRLGDLESGSIRDAFAALGLDQREFQGAFQQDPVAALREQFGPAFARVAAEQGSERATFLSEEVFGGSEAARVLPLATQSVEEFAAARERAARIPFYSEEQLSVLLEASHATDRLSDAWSGLADELTGSAAPATIAVRDAMSEAIEATTRWAGENDALAGALGTAFGAISGVGGLIAGLAPVLIGIPPLISLITAAWGALNLAFLVSPIGLLILAVVGSVAALVAIGYVVYRNWDTILAFLTDAWGNVQKAVGDAIDSLRIRWNDFVSSVFDGIRRVVELVTGVAGFIGGALGIDTSSLDRAQELLDSVQRTVTIGEGAGANGNVDNRVVNQTNYIDVSGVSDPDMVVEMVGDEIAARTER